MSKRMISLEISDELREKLRVEAFNKRLAISATIRIILENYFVENDNAEVRGFYTGDTDKKRENI